MLSHEDVLDGAVVGTPHPTDGQLLTAIVELRPGAKVTSQQLLTYVNGKERINTRTGHETNTRTRETELKNISIVIQDYETPAPTLTL